MKAFVLTVLASCVGSALLILLAGILSRRARWILTGILGLMVGVDIDYVHRNKEDAQQELEKAIKRASDVAVLAGRGNELQRTAFSSLFLDRPHKREVRVRILLPDTSVPEGSCDWLLQREQELAAFDPSFGKNLLRTQVDTNVEFLRKLASSGMLELRRYNYPNVGRIVLTDHSCFFTPYEKDMSETLIIAILAIAVVYLLMMSKNLRKKSRDVKRRIKDRAWHRDE